MGILAVQDIFMMILLSLPQSLGVMAAASSIATGFGLIVAVVGVAVAAARLIGAARLKVLLSQERDQDVFLLGLVGAGTGAPQRSAALVTRLLLTCL